jgi:plastocyanin
MFIRHSPGVRLAPALLLFALACGGDSSGPSNGGNNNAQPPDALPDLDININPGASTNPADAFTPDPKGVALNGGANVSVRWVNLDVTGGEYQSGTVTVHRIEPTNPANGFTASGNLGRGSTHTVSFSAPGTYDYHCSLHPTMVGSIVVNP